MKRWVLLAALAIFTGLGHAGSHQDPAIAASPAAPQGPLILEKQQCSSYYAGEVEADFLWWPAGGDAWFDISVFDNGFVPGTFIAIGPFDGGNNSRHQVGLKSNLTHYFRVNSLTPNGWVTTQTLAVRTLDCTPAPAPSSAMTYKLYGPIRYCQHDGRTTDTYSWEPLGRNMGAPPQGPQWLDVSLVNNGFAPGTFFSIGPIPGNVGYQVAPSLGSRDTVHYWRINTLTPLGWVASPTQQATFPRLSPPGFPQHDGCG
jgi:hypothetical protein